MRVLMIAPPGAGKGTPGALIATHFGIPHIATGDLLRVQRDAMGPMPGPGWSRRRVR
jgi:adenylate kinase family enzyme